MQSFIADGNIYPCRFVTQASATEPRVLACGAGVQPYGISQKATRRSPYVDSTGYAASAGEPLKVYDRDGEQCPLELGGTVTAGQFIKASTAGVGVAATADGELYGAHANVGGVSGEIIMVTVRVGIRGA
jgi:hypothetical protein